MLWGKLRYRGCLTSKKSPGDVMLTLVWQLSLESRSKANITSPGLFLAPGHVLPWQYHYTQRYLVWKFIRKLITIHILCLTRTQTVLSLLSGNIDHHATLSYPVDGISVSTLKLKKGLESWSQVSGVYFQRGDPLSAWCSEQGLPDSRMCWHLYISVR